MIDRAAFTAVEWANLRRAVQLWLAEHGSPEAEPLPVLTVAASRMTGAETI